MGTELSTNEWENTWKSAVSKIPMKHPYFKLMSGFPIDRIPTGFYPPLPCPQNPCLVSHSIFLNRSRMEEFFFCFITPLNSVWFCLWKEISSNAALGLHVQVRQTRYLFDVSRALLLTELDCPLVSQPSSTSGPCPGLP